MEKSQIASYKPSFKRNKRVVGYLNDSEYEKFNAIRQYHEESEAQIIREALRLYFKKNEFIFK